MTRVNHKNPITLTWDAARGGNKTYLVRATLKKAIKKNRPVRFECRGALLNVTSNIEKRRDDTKDIRPIIAQETFRVSYPFAYRTWKDSAYIHGTEAAFCYAEKWAKLMQAETRAGKRLSKKLILNTGEMAATANEDISTIYMARGILATYWARGHKFAALLGINIEDLRETRWKICIENARLSRMKSK